MKAAITKGATTKQMMARTSDGNLTFDPGEPGRTPAEAARSDLRYEFFMGAKLNFLTIWHKRNNTKISPRKQRFFNVKMAGLSGRSEGRASRCEFHNVKSRRSQRKRQLRNWGDSFEVKSIGAGKGLTNPPNFLAQWRLN